jgi:hypothetical protein
MKTPSLIIPYIESKVDELWDEWHRVQLVPHDNNEGYIEKKQTLKQIDLKIQSLTLT